MDEPLLPTAALRKWRWATLATAAFSAGVTIVYITILLAGRDAGVLLPRLMQLAVYLSAIGAASCAGRFNIEMIHNHIDQRVNEAAGRMDRRLTSIGNAMIEHGIKLDDITEEIPRLREHVRVVRAHAHSHAPALYQATDKMTVVGTARVEQEPKAIGLDPSVLEMGERIARRLHEAD